MEKKIKIVKTVLMWLAIGIAASAWGAGCALFQSGKNASDHSAHNVWIK